MLNTLKNKITLGLTFLLVLLVLSGIVGIYNLSELRSDAKKIIQDNYESLSYCRSISDLLDSLPKAEVISKIEKNVQLQEKNITEKGEGEATNLLRSHWLNAQKSNFSSKDIPEIRKDLNRIQLLNLDAINRKNEQAENTADKALLIIIIISTLVIFSALAFLFRFPTIITRPIQELQKGIQEITNKNYSHKVSIPNDNEMAMLATAFNQMSQQLHDYEQSNLAKLMFEKTRAEAVINSFKDAGIGIDNGGKILFANPQALSLLNLKAEDIIGKQINSIAERNDLFRFIISDEQNTPFKIVQDNKDSFFTKEKVPIEVKGKSIGNLYTLKNITSFQEKDIAKTNFLATISHELKTPLSSTDFALKLLSNSKIGELNEEQKRLIENISNDNERLIKLVSELLDMSQAETGKINLNISTCNINEVVQYAIHALKSLIEQKKIKINLLGFENEIKIRADKEKSIWVLVNILSNAIRYSPDGDEINVAIANKTANDVTISIKDNGKGIPPEHRNSIFQRFYKVNDKEQGTGLGLSIAKEFMEAMNGKVNLFDDNTTGANFIITFKK